MVHPIISAIALSVIGNFATDLVKWAAGGPVPPLDTAVQSTADSFPDIEGIRETLRRWLVSREVSEVLHTYLEGEIGSHELPMAELVNLLLDKTGFYLPEHSRSAAEKIIGTFLAKVRAAYLTTSSVGPLYIANRQEARFDALEDKVQRLAGSVESGGGLKPALQTHFDQAVGKLEGEDFPAAKALFESLLAELERSPLQDRDLERRIHANLGKVASNLGENEQAVKHYRMSSAIDDDPVRAAVNSAVAELVEQNWAQALQRLEAVRDPKCSPAFFEYSAARVGALIRLKRYQEAIDTARRIDVKGKESRQLELLGLAHREAGDIHFAEKAYRDALAIDTHRPELQYSLAESLFGPVIRYRNEHLGIPLPSRFVGKVHEAGDLLEAAAKTLRRQGRTRAAFEVDSALAVVRGLQDRFSDAIRILEPLTQAGHATPDDWRHLGFAYLVSGHLAKAADAFKCAIAGRADPDAEFLFGQALILSGKSDEALEFVRVKATEPITTENFRFHVTKAKAFAAKRQFSRARDVMSAVHEALPDNAEVLLTLAELFEVTGNEAEAQKAYEEALLNATGVDELRVRYQYGGLLAAKREYGRAVELWRPLARPDRPSTLLDNYMLALYKNGNLAEAASIAAGMKAKGASVSAMFANVAAAAYQRLDDLNEAGGWLEYLCDRYGNQPEHIVSLSNIKFRLGLRDEAEELLDASKATLKDAKDIMGYAQAYSILGRYQEAVELGCRAVHLANDPDIHMAFVAIFLRMPESVERKPEEISTFQDVLSKFKERFPQSTHLQSFTIDPEHPLDAIRETLTKQSQRGQAAVEAYKRNRMTVQIFADLLGKDLYDVWLSIIADPELMLLCATGTEEESDEFQRLLSTATGVIVDPIFLFTLSFLGITDKLVTIGDMYIAQRALDQLHELHAQRHVAHRQRGVMGMIDGQFFLHETTPQQVERANSALRTATEWAEKCARAVGLKEPLNKEDMEWGKLLGLGSLATIVTAKQRGLILLTDDKTLADIGKQNYGISFVNAQAVLIYLRAHGALTAAEYDKSVLKLVEAGYTFIRIDDGHLFSVVSDEQFQLTARLKRIFRVIEPVTVSLVPACAAVAGLLRRIYLESIPDDMKDQLAFFVLDTIGRNHPRMEVQRHVRTLLRRQMSPLLVLQLRKIEKVLDRW